MLSLFHFKVSKCQKVEASGVYLPQDDVIYQFLIFVIFFVKGKQNLQLEIKI